MSERTKFHEFLTAENAAVLLVDHQVGLYSGVRDIGLRDLKHNVVSLAKRRRRWTCLRWSPPRWRTACGAR
jgi:hypothetical protein